MNLEAQWQAVLQRDARHDGRFFYAVRTTGVFCRASCPSRRPRRSVVEFFPSALAAERAGYRACKRCRPKDKAPGQAISDRARQYLDRDPGRKVTLDELAAHMALSPFHLQRIFKRSFGVSPKQYQDARRTARFKQRLGRGGKVTDALYAAGYGSSSRAYEKSEQRLGMTPAQYRKKGAGIMIRYIFTKTRLGSLLIAATEKGICGLQMGDDRAAMLKDLRAEFSAATLQRDEHTLQPFATALQKYLSGDERRLDLPLDVQATVFQQRVWKELRAIPYGATRSYTEIARKVGSPKAVRAVARACATNPVALVTPCHRVIRESGDLAGYRWGLERKAALLELEKK